MKAKYVIDGCHVEKVKANAGYLGGLSRAVDITEEIEGAQGIAFLVFCRGTIAIPLMSDRYLQK